MLTEQDLRNQKELMQNDLQCILDGADQQIIDNACQVVVDRMNILIGLLTRVETGVAKP